MLPTFPSRYWFAVGLQVVFSLAGWSPPIPAGFLVSCRTQVRVPATEGIDVSFSSCRYLDVSVPCVRPGYLSGGGHSARRVSPFGHARIISCLRIPAPLRSLPRPSSPPEAQASPVRSCNLLSLSESYIRFRVCLEIAVPLFLAELLVFSFFAFTSLSFPILSMIFVALSSTLSSEMGCKDTHFFITSKSFSSFFQKNHRIPCLISDLTWITPRSSGHSYPRQHSGLQCIAPNDIQKSQNNGYPDIMRLPSTLSRL